ncbi:MAG: NUDIX domain-containing protein [Candidatus Moranbacteria bacterium]|nr:NUDIX domain-containing protein [Candidatus Moranbacteria bacterium]
MKNDQFEVIARAIILRENKILICRSQGHPWWFFPGGHIEFGEKSAEALEREIQEEIGSEIKNINFVGAVENHFRQNGQIHHEFNLVFRAELKDQCVDSREDHLKFKWLDLKSVPPARIYPVALKKALLKWIKDGKIFWVSQF